MRAPCFDWNIFSQSTLLIVFERSKLSSYRAIFVPLTKNPPFFHGGYSSNYLIVFFLFINKITKTTMTRKPMAAMTQIAPTARVGNADPDPFFDLFISSRVFQVAVSAATSNFFTEVKSSLFADTCSPALTSMLFPVAFEVKQQFPQLLLRLIHRYLAPGPK